MIFLGLLINLIDLITLTLLGMNLIEKWSKK